MFKTIRTFSPILRTFVNAKQLGTINKATHNIQKKEFDIQKKEFDILKKQVIVLKKDFNDAYGFLLVVSSVVAYGVGYTMNVIQRNLAMWLTARFVIIYIIKCTIVTDNSLKGQLFF